MMACLYVSGAECKEKLEHIQEKLFTPVWMLDDDKSHALVECVTFLKESILG